MPVKRYFLKGIDYFQLLIDHHNKRYGGPGHEARLAIFLEGTVTEKSVNDLLSRNELCNRLCHLHISKSFGLGYPSLVFSGKKINIPVSFHHVDGNTIPAELLNKPVDVYHLPPLHVSVLYFTNSTSCLLFTFHHILFDFAGVQSFINSLAGMKNIPLMAPEGKPSAFNVRFRRFFRAVFFTFREANRRMTFPERVLPVVKPLNILYREMQFTETETLATDNNCLKRGLQFNKSIFQVACVCKALHDEIFTKQNVHNFIWVPVPVNVRRKGVKDAILFNQLSFLFYKLSAGVLTTLDATIEALKFQMMDQVRKELPQAFIDFANGYWYMPMPFYYPMMNLPSLGKLSSLSFSTLGNTFKEMNDFLELPVAEIKNFPSNSISPGFTFLFYEFRGTLRLMTSWVEGQYTADEQQRVISKVRKLMLETNW